MNMKKNFFNFPLGKKTILSVLMAILVLGLAQFASADDSCFVISIDVDDDKVKPGESFTVEVDVESDYDVGVEDIEVEVVVKDMDDGDDLDDDGDIDDLDDKGDDDKIDFDFETPYAVKDKDYDIEITVKGDAENGTDCETIVNATVEVEKDKHEMIMKQPVVDLETLKCSRTTELSVTLWNIGDKDEDVDLEITNSELGINKKQSFDLDSGDDEDDIKKTKRFMLDLTDAAAKTYTFFVKASYDDGDEYESETVSIKVEDCETAPPEEEEEEEEVVVEPTPVVLPPQVTVPAVVEEESFMEAYGTALLLALAYLVVIVVGVILVVSLLRRRG